MVRPYHVIEGNHAFRWVFWVGEEGVVHEDVIDEGRVSAWGLVGDGTLRDGRDQSRSIKPLLKLVMPAGGGNVRGGPQRRMGIKITAK